MASDLTRKQIEALEAALHKGGAWYGLRGRRAGGAYGRMCDRLAERGLVDKRPPHPITLDGLKALRLIAQARYARSGSAISIIRLEEIDAAIAEAA